MVMSATCGWKSRYSSSRSVYVAETLPAPPWRTSSNVPPVTSPTATSPTSSLWSASTSAPRCQAVGSVITATRSLFTHGAVCLMSLRLGCRTYAGILPRSAPTGQAQQGMIGANQSRPVEKGRPSGHGLPQNSGVYFCKLGFRAAGSVKPVESIDYSPSRGARCWWIGSAG